MKLKQSFSEVQELLDKMETQNISFNQDDFDIVSESTGNFITLGYNKNFYSDNATQDMDSRFVIFEYFKCGSSEPKILYPTTCGSVTITNVAKRFYSAENVIQSNYASFVSGTTKYVRYIFLTNTSQLTSKQCDEIAENFTITVDGVLYQLKTNNVGSIQHVSLKNKTFSSITETYHFLSTFEKIVFIGDSLTAGYTSYKTPTVISSNLARAANRNWPYYLALRNGRENTGINKGYGSTKAHDGRYKSTTLFDAPDGDEMAVVMGLTDTQIYHLAIGYNDRGTTLGTIDDVSTSSPDNNPDTYCGNLGGMISKLLTVNTTCRIVVSTMPNIKGKVSIDENWNAAIRNVANKFKDTGRVFLLDLGSSDYTDYYNADILSKTWNGHLFPLAYEYVSWITEKAYEDMLMKNYESFAYLPLLS